MGNSPQLATTFGQAALAEQDYTPAALQLKGGNLD
jgi:hypothetical protein